MTGGKRETATAARRRAIIDAAYEEFFAKGFAAARVEDIAKRAAVAKGTIYLHFVDKQALFEGMVRDMLPPRKDIDAFLGSMSLKSIFEDLLIPGAIKFPASRNANVLRLLLSEGLRIPSVAEFYYREILQPVLESHRRVLKKAAADGELIAPEVANHPLIMEAPLLFSVVWYGLFDRFEPLDGEAFMRAFSKCLLKPEIFADSD